MGDRQKLAPMAPTMQMAIATHRPSIKALDTFRSSLGAWSRKVPADPPFNFSFRESRAWANELSDYCPGRSTCFSRMCAVQLVSFFA